MSLQALRALKRWDALNNILLFNYLIYYIDDNDDDDDYDDDDDDDDDDCCCCLCYYYYRKRYHFKPEVAKTPAKRRATVLAIEQSTASTIKSKHN